MTQHTPSRLLHRRSILAGLAAAGLLPLAAVTGKKLFSADRQSTEHGEVWFSAAIVGNDGFGAAWHNRAGHVDGHVPTDFRGHGAALHPTRPNSALLFARRPGYMGIEVDLASGELVKQFHCAQGRHLYGHGCFSADGKVLFTTEADIEGGAGKIGIRDADTYQLLGEYDSYGVGPHELRLMPDGKTLVVANGGLLTRPDTGRRVLNLDTMDSSLVYIDTHSGELVDQVRVAEPKASHRHLDVANDGTVAVAIQVQREATHHTDLVPLAITHRRGEPARALHEPQPVLAKLQDYMGSVAISNTSRRVGFTSPRGNLAVFWDIESGEFVGQHSMRDVCGLATDPSQSRFILSSSSGQMRVLDSTTLQEQREQRVNAAGLHWDNHMVVTQLS